MLWCERRTCCLPLRVNSRLCWEGSGRIRAMFPDRSHGRDFFVDNGNTNCNANDIHTSIHTNNDHKLILCILLCQVVSLLHLSSFYFVFVFTNSIKFCVHVIDFNLRSRAGIHWRCHPALVGKALEIPAALLRFDPSKRQHPVRLLRQVGNMNPYACVGFRVQIPFVLQESLIVCWGFGCTLGKEWLLWCSAGRHRTSSSTSLWLQHGSKLHKTSWRVAHEEIEIERNQRQK